ncbi:MAG: hypothetical protein WC635_10025 [Bacteriovorax sp.]|jgi:hypothetical protein
MEQAESKPWYIHTQKSDLLFIILCPLLAFLFVLAICEPRMKNGAFLYGSETPYWFAIVSTLLTHTHVLLVFIRSHLNQTVFKRYKYRFTLIPLIVLGSMWVSPLFFGALGILAFYWDEYHSIMQTFGFGRIYDSKMGNDVAMGRKLDMFMCFVLGLLPHLILFTYIPDVQRSQGLIDYFDMTEKMIANFGWVLKSLRIPFYAFGILYTLFYIHRYRELHKFGYKMPMAKLALFAVTGLTTILTACFFTVADGIFFGNIYHALQYMFIVFVSERPNLADLTGLKKQEHKTGLNLIYFLVVIPFFLVIAALRQKTSTVPYLAAFWLLTSLLHFWFDGFIWSVRRQDV